jgi:hypothetical protein
MGGPFTILRFAEPDLDDVDCRHADGSTGHRTAQQNWLNLWKPTVGALGQILGSTGPGRSWHLQHSRVVV